MSYTIVLLRPEYLAEQTGMAHGQDTFVYFSEESDTLNSALEEAIDEVYERDTKAGLLIESRSHYIFCIAFRGYEPEVLVCPTDTGDVVEITVNTTREYGYGH